MSRQPSNPFAHVAVNITLSCGVRGSIFANSLKHRVSGSSGINKHVMLPQTKHGPTFTLEPFCNLPIPGHVALNLRYPPLAPAGEEVSQAISATPPDFLRVAMPHVAIYEHSEATGPDDNIRLTWHIFGVKAITQPSSVKGSTEA
jgi:hypothetical protein